MNTALAIVPDERPHAALIHPVLDAAGVMQLHNAIADLVQKTLVEGKDFGVIPGTNKPSLYKSGAERLCVGFGLVDTYEIIEYEANHIFENLWEKRKKDDTIYKSGIALGLYSYTVKCLLRRREDNQIVAEGVGYCSSLETKYCDRPRDVANTILKMAKKRAKVDATLSGLGLSDRFTQDTEDQDRDTEDERGQRTSRPTGEEVKTPDVSKMTLADARKITLRGKEGSWGGAAKKPIGEAQYSVVKAALTYFTSKLAEKPDDIGLAIDARALALVEHDMRENEGVQDAGDVAVPDSPARTDERTLTTASPGPVAPDNRTRWSTATLQAHVLSLLTHPSLSKGLVDGYRDQINSGAVTKVQLVQMSEILDEKIMRAGA